MHFKEKIGITLKTGLRRITLPPKLTYIWLQEWSLFEIRLIRGSQIEVVLLLAPTGNLRYLKGRNSILQLRKYSDNSKKGRSPLIPIRLLLWKLTPRPDANSKSIWIALVAHKFSIEEFTKISISSTCWRWETSKEGPTRKPEKRLSWKTLLINSLRSLTTNRKRKGARGSPYFNPLWILISSIGEPLTRADRLTANTQALI